VFRGHNKPLTSVALTNNYVVTGSEDKTARVWDLTGIGAFTVASATLRSETREYKGKCPVTIKLTGTIDATGKSGTVKYRFIRTGNTPGITITELPKELLFDAPGSQNVSTTYDVYFNSGVKGQPEDFWVELEILEPVNLKSARANFAVQCDVGGEQTVSSADLTAKQLAQIMPNLPAAAREQYLPYLKSAMAEFGISTPLRQAAFLGQVAHESAEFRFLEEIGSGAYYEGRKDLGNTQPQDGPRFKGRGAMQIVGRANYKRFGEKLGVDLIEQPERAASPEIAFRIAALVWQTYGLNELADRQDYKMITRRINGGYSGLADRIKYYDKAKQVLGIPPTP
jgi:predicted chitinase